MLQQFHSHKCNIKALETYVEQRKPDIEAVLPNKPNLMRIHCPDSKSSTLIGIICHKVVTCWFVLFLTVDYSRRNSRDVSNVNETTIELLPGSLTEIKGHEVMPPPRPPTVSSFHPEAIITGHCPYCPFYLFALSVVYYSIGMPINKYSVSVLSVYISHDGHQTHLCIM